MESSQERWRRDLLWAFVLNALLLDALLLVLAVVGFGFAALALGATVYRGVALVGFTCAITGGVAAMVMNGWILRGADQERGRWEAQVVDVWLRVSFLVGVLGTLYGVLLP
jgi:hypothetical protein